MTNWKNLGVYVESGMRLQTTREEFQGITKKLVCSWLEYVIHILYIIKNKINFRQYSFQVLSHHLFSALEVVPEHTLYLSCLENSLLKVRLVFLETL